MATKSLTLFSLGTGLFIASPCAWVGSDCFQQQRIKAVIQGEFPGLLREGHVTSPGLSPWMLLRGNQAEQEV